MVGQQTSNQQSHQNSNRKYIEIPENQAEKSTIQHELSIENLDIHSNFESNYATDKINSAIPEKNE
jgi:hypothetical protein